MKRVLLLASAAAAISLAACSDNADDTVDATDAAVPTADTAMMDDNAMPMGGDLTTQQQTNYDAMDRQAISDEYDTNRDTMMAQSTSTPGATPTGTASSGTSDMAAGNASSGDMSSGDSMSGSSSSNSMMPRGQMDFAYLDRNNDGKLSVAEYAIWAVPANPNNQTSMEDATKPYISTEQINDAGKTFFFFDKDGNTYLSPEEFTMARNSARAPGASATGATM
ncbi:hypothetical protein F7D01_00555 [Erythrobacter sp. 3-20A1M]|uniref:hypothetical protein n=1 Tax=Erythrobacter sp. 3-20A1M TaxID=2653850 RepID=UPI001BFC2474|nr:hypothetical protein [Erythrobacter sp. 3-20A1M]QWC55773.1 hypothetical protein F7D01_00555 [Erythrobacter sp. 3-20A1M]